MKSSKICVIALMGLMLAVFASGIACAQSTTWWPGNEASQLNSGQTVSWTSNIPLNSQDICNVPVNNYGAWLNVQTNLDPSYSSVYGETTWTFSGNNQASGWQSISYGSNNAQDICGDVYVTQAGYQYVTNVDDVFAPGNGNDYYASPDQTLELDG
jgi:hypothetical protein